MSRTKGSKNYNRSAYAIRQKRLQDKFPSKYPMSMEEFPLYVINLPTGTKDAPTKATLSTKMEACALDFQYKYAKPSVEIQDQAGKQQDMFVLVREDGEPVVQAEK